MRISDWSSDVCSSDLGVVAGYPIQDVRVVVHDGKYHPVDSKEIAFVTAGRKAFVDAVNKGRPQLLEPIVELQVVVPDSQTGDITGALASKDRKSTRLNSRH